MLAEIWHKRLKQLAFDHTGLTHSDPLGLE
jgi:hypothetical protein